ncbi:uncharacterized protein LOC117178527 [Belonocnema kinseyi]|uniref:uncharacterized protein LOC117178527 n=1 Tax=Belonocnema kinseyi TaxID=2817044 RepID=UPI00143CE00E|nr:uncharacterized protein LOC117178527 [Belonocnema kinseyi]
MCWQSNEIWTSHLLSIFLFHNTNNFGEIIRGTRISDSSIRFDSDSEKSSSSSSSSSNSSLTLSSSSNSRSRSRSISPVSSRQPLRITLPELSMRTAPPLGAPRVVTHDPYHPSNYIPATLSRPLEWERFRFPVFRGLKFFGIPVVTTDKTDPALMLLEDDYIRIPTKKKFPVQVSPAGEIFGFKRPPRPTPFRIFEGPTNIMVAVHKDYPHWTRPITDHEKAFLENYPYGVY